MDKRMFGGLLVLAAASLLGICNTIIPTAFWFAAMLGILLAIGIAVWMLLSCKSLDVMADISAALTGCIWGVLLGISLMAGWLKLLTKRSMHPYDEAAYGIICVVSLLLALIVLGFDIALNEKKQSFRRFALQGSIAVSLTPVAMGPAYILMLVFEVILSGYV